MNYKLPRVWVKDFILQYRDHECLWNVTHPNFKDRVARQQAKEILLEKVREVIPNAETREISKRIERWRHCVTPNVRRLIESAQPGYEGPIFVPKLWLFPLLIFLYEDRYPNLPALCQAIGLPRPEDVDAREPTYKTDEDGEEESKRHVDSTRHRAVWEELFRLYRKYPFMWKKKCYALNAPGEFQARKEAMRILLAKYRELYPRATIYALSAKLLNCRNAHRRELKRLLTAREEGEKYKPKTWYFKALSYINKHEAKDMGMVQHLLPEEIVNTDDEDYETIETMVGSDEYSDDSSQQETSSAVQNIVETGYSNNDDSQNDTIIQYEEIDENWDVVEAEDITAAESCNEDDEDTKESFQKPPKEEPVASPAKPVYVKTSKLETPRVKPHIIIRQSIPVEHQSKQIKRESLTPPTTMLSHSPKQKRIRLDRKPAPVVVTQNQTVPKDRFDVVGENIACKMRYMDSDQRIRAEKLINDVLYYAELNALDRHSALVIAEAID